MSRRASPMKLKAKANTAVRGPSAADGGKWSNRDDYQPGPPTMACSGAATRDWFSASPGTDRRSDLGDGYSGSSSGVKQILSAVFWRRLSKARAHSGNGTMSEIRASTLI